MASTATALRVQIWEFPQLLRRGATAGSLWIGDQPWLVAPAMVMSIGSSRSRGSLYVLSLCLYGPYGRERRACLLIESDTMLCPDLETEITRSISRWLPASSEREPLVFRPRCDGHPACRAQRRLRRAERRLIEAVAEGAEAAGLLA